ncbi:leucine-rich repeat domain-containing protein [Stenotrophomonas rhizophila]
MKIKKMNDKKYAIMHSDDVETYMDPQAEIVFFNRPFDEKLLSKIEVAQLWVPHTRKLSAMPEMIGKIQNLRSLSYIEREGSSVVSSLKEGDIPVGLEILEIGGTTRIRWPGVVFPGLKTLYVEQPFTFSASCFPALASISIYPDRKLVNVKEAVSLPLTELNLLSVPVGSEIFNEVAVAPLSALGLLGGRSLKTLDGISQLNGITSVLLKNMTSLEDIRELATLPQLRKLNIQNCKHIKNIEVLNELDSLEDLVIVSCGNLGLSKVESKLSSLNKRIIGATT